MRLKHDKNERQRSGFDLKAAIAGVFLSALIILPFTIRYVQYKVSSARPDQQIVVIDFAQTVSQLSLGNKDGPSIEQSVELMDSLIKELADAGFVVLDRQAVLNAPSSTYLSIDTAKQFIAAKNQ